MEHIASERKTGEVELNVGSLFSGIGGIELGFKREGFKTKWFVEYEPYCQEVLKEHFPEAEIYGDITKLDFSKIPRVDILTGGFPCQDISLARCTHVPDFKMVMI